MSDRLEELAMRRRRLLLRSERLRADLAADQRVVLDALSGVDSVLSKAKQVAKPALIIGGALLLFKLLRRGKKTTAGAGLAMKALFWLSVAQRAMPYVSLARNLWRSRSSPSRGYADAGAETEHLL
jgi:hypothetical protein